MAQTETWYLIDSQHRLMARTENDGHAFLRHGACAVDRPADIDRMSAAELRQALRAALAALADQKGTAR